MTKHRLEPVTDGNREIVEEGTRMSCHKKDSEGNNNLELLAQPSKPSSSEAVSYFQGSNISIYMQRGVLILHFFLVAVFLRFEGESP